MSYCAISNVSLYPRSRTRTDPRPWYVLATHAFAWTRYLGYYRRWKSGCRPTTSVSPMRCGWLPNVFQQPCGQVGSGPLPRVAPNVWSAGATLLDLTYVPAVPPPLLIPRLRILCTANTTSIQASGALAASTHVADLPFFRAFLRYSNTTFHPPLVHDSSAHRCKPSPLIVKSFLALSETLAGLGDD